MSLDDHDDEPCDYRRRMASPILMCTDGSDEALGALSSGLELLGRDHDFVLVTVMNAPDEESLAGSGHAGPELTPAEYDDLVAQAGETADPAIGKAQSELALVGAEIRIVRGDPGATICQLATELSARAIVMGSRGRGGVKRAFLGSVSDHVVRRAPCSVVVTRI
jgi:nucleotide-binding universal stress UspA family protein